MRPTSAGEVADPFDVSFLGSLPNRRPPERQPSKSPPARNGNAAVGASSSSREQERADVSTADLPPNITVGGHDRKRKAADDDLAKPAGTLLDASALSSNASPGPEGEGATIVSLPSGNASTSLHQDLSNLEADVTVAIKEAIASVQSSEHENASPRRHHTMPVESLPPNRLPEEYIQDVLAALASAKQRPPVSDEPGSPTHQSLPGIASEDLERQLRDAIEAIKMHSLAQTHTHKRAHNREIQALKKSMATERENMAAEMSKQAEELAAMRDANTEMQKKMEERKEEVYKLQQEHELLESQYAAHSLKLEKVQKELEAERDPKQRYLKRLAGWRVDSLDHRERERQQKEKKVRAAQRATYLNFRAFFHDGTKVVQAWVRDDFKSLDGLEKKRLRYWQQAEATFRHFAEVAKKKDAFQHRDIHSSGLARELGKKEISAQHKALDDRLKHRNFLFDKLSRYLQDATQKCLQTSNDAAGLRSDFNDFTLVRLRRCSHYARLSMKLVRHRITGDDSAADFMPRRIFAAATTAKLKRPIMTAEQAVAWEHDRISKSIVEAKDSQEQSLLVWQKRIIIAQKTVLSLAHLLSQGHDNLALAGFMKGQPLSVTLVSNIVEPLTSILSNLRSALGIQQKEFVRLGLRRHDIVSNLAAAYNIRGEIDELESILQRNASLAVQYGRFSNAQIKTIRSRQHLLFENAMEQVRSILNDYAKSKVNITVASYRKLGLGTRGDVEILKNANPLENLSPEMSKPALITRKERRARNEARLRNTHRAKPSTTITVNAPTDSPAYRTVKAPVPDHMLADSNQPKPTADADVDADADADDFGSFDSPMDAFESLSSEPTNGSDKVPTKEAQVLADTPKAKNPESGEKPTSKVLANIPKAESSGSGNGKGESSPTLRRQGYEYEDDPTLSRIAEIMGSGSPRFAIAPKAQSRPLSSRSFPNSMSGKGSLPRPDWMSARRRRGNIKPTSPRMQGLQAGTSDVAEQVWMAHEDSTIGSASIPQYPASDDTMSSAPGRQAVTSQSTQQAGNDDSAEGLGASHTSKPQTQEQHPKLKYQIPPQVLRNALLASQTSGAAFWKHSLYKGPFNEKITIHYCTRLEQAEREAKHFANEEVLGFDLEWEPSAKLETGTIKDNVSLIQIASESRIALFQLASFSGNTIEMLMPPSLRAILESPRILKAGVNIGADFTRLRKSLQIEGQGIFELSHLFKIVKYSENEPTKVDKKLRKLADQVSEMLYLPLSKGEVRTSAWSRRLSVEQIEYAATDAYAGFRLFHALESRRKAMNPTPPRPANYELQLPLILGNGQAPPRRKGGAAVNKAGKDVEMAAAENNVDNANAAREETMLPSQDEADAVLQSDEDYYSCESCNDGIEEDESSSNSPQSDKNIAKAAGTMTAQSDTPPPAPQELIEAEQWVAHWHATYATSNPARKPRVTPSCLRAYALWYPQSLSLKQIATLLRTPPLATTSVAQYVLEAIKQEDLPFNPHQVREAFACLPMSARVRYQSIAAKLKTMENGG